MSSPALKAFAPPEEPTKDLTLLAKLYLSLRVKADEIKDKLKTANEGVDQAEVTLLQAMSSSGLKTIKLESGEQIACVEKHVYALPNKDAPEQRASALAWLKRVGGRSMIELSIHASTLTAFLRQRAESKRPISPLIKDTVLRGLSVTNLNAKPKAKAKNNEVSEASGAADGEGGVR